MYISLGGNRRGSISTQINLVITMLLGGLWHGASWNFVIWGALHGLGLIVHKHWTSLSQGWAKVRSALPYTLLMSAITLLFVLFLWIPFRAPDFDTTLHFVQGMFTGGGIGWINPEIVMVLAMAFMWHMTHARQATWLYRFPDERPSSFVSLFILGGCLLLIALFAPDTTSPFIYFQF